MELDTSLLRRIGRIEWFSECGTTSRPILDFPTRWLDERTTALQSLFSTEWADATTHAQGELTSYLARIDYNTYGTTWNRLATESQALLEEAVGTRLSAAIEAGSWPATLAETLLPEVTPAVSASIGMRMTELLAARAWDQCLAAKTLVNVSRALLEATYRQRFPKAPIFFERLLEVYEAGRLPCGWEGDLEDWPTGKLMVF